MNYSKLNTAELLREEERLRTQYNEIEEECLKEGLSFSEFTKRAQKEREGLYLIDKHKRLRQDPIVEYGKEWKGDTYTLDEFKKMAKSKLLTDYDGFGYYATESAKSDVEIYPSDVLENLIREDFSHVIWFNK